MGREKKRHGMPCPYGKKHFAAEMATRTNRREIPHCARNDGQLRTLNDGACRSQHLAEMGRSMLRPYERKKKKARS
jgi:hypothetical protein